MILHMPEIALPPDLAMSHAMIRELHAECHDLRGKNADLLHQLDRMTRHMYGRRSEQCDPAQLELAFAALRLELAAALPALANASDPRAKAKHKGHGRRPLPANLPRTVRVLEPEDADLVCSCCGHAKARIGEERSEQLDYRPATFQVIETVRPKYACSKCKDGVTTALPISRLPPHLMVSLPASAMALWLRSALTARRKSMPFTKRR